MTEKVYILFGLFNKVGDKRLFMSKKKPVKRIANHPLVNFDINMGINTHEYEFSAYFGHYAMFILWVSGIMYFIMLCFRYSYHLQILQQQKLI